MKTRTGLVLGLVLGVAGSAVAFRTVPGVAKLVDPQPIESWRPVSHALMRGEMAIVRTKDAVGVIELKDFGSNGASYRWRARAIPLGEEQHGVGVLKQEMEAKPRVDGTIWLDSKRSFTLIAAGPIKTQWSYRSINSGFLIFDDRIDVSIVSAELFETISLSQIASQFASR